MPSLFEIFLSRFGTWWLGRRPDHIVVRVIGGRTRRRNFRFSRHSGFLVFRMLRRIVQCGRSVPGVTSSMHGSAEKGHLADMSIASSHCPSSFGFDHSLLLLRDGYQFWDSMRQRQGSEIVQTRLLHERVTAIRGPAAAQFFYEENFTERASALPTALVGALFGKGPVHMLDGDAHVHRKTMFNQLLDPSAVADMTNDLARKWDERSVTWHGRVDVFQEVGQMLLEVGCGWVGIPLRETEIPKRTRDMLAMVEGFGAPTPRQLKARSARKRTDSWVQGFVEQSRATSDGGQTPLDVVAHHRDRDGELLSAHTAAVEVINLIRPLVAVSWLVSGLFEAFDTFPQRRADLLAQQFSAIAVANEVRRTYPFVPFLATRATQDLAWEDANIPKGTLVVLDVWGTNHDPRIWNDPTSFDPARFEHTPVTPYNLVPQGGGSRESGHRCPGEDTTVAVLATLARRIAELHYDVAGPRANLRRMPPEARCIVKVAQ